VYLYVSCLIRWSI